MKVVTPTVCTVFFPTIEHYPVELNITSIKVTFAVKLLIAGNKRKYYHVCVLLNG